MCHIRGNILAEKVRRLESVSHSEASSTMKEVSKNLEESKIPLSTRLVLRHKFANIKKSFIQKENAIKSSEVTDVA